MGCDIHLVLEKYDDKLCEWVGLHNYDYLYNRAFNNAIGDYSVSYKVRQRDYNFFAHLAGVRAHGDGTYPVPKGIPPDASSLTLHRHNSWEHDAHSASHMTLKEFAYIYAREVKENSDELLHSLVVERLEGTESHETIDLYREITAVYVEPIEIDKYRIVFWFDN